MDSFPQLQRCFERQWAGLDEHSRHWIDDSVVPGFVPFRPDDMSPGQMFPIWYVERPDCTVESGQCLISMKMD